MQNIEIPASIAQNSEWLTRVRVATTLLDEEIGSAAARVSAKWNLISHNGLPGFELEISDYTGCARARFALDELQDSRHLRDRLHRLWGDLLQDRSHKEIARLHELVSQMGDD